MPINKRRICWDSCIFLSWLKNEPRAAGVNEGIEQIVQLVDQHKILLMTSVLTYTEVLYDNNVMSDLHERFVSFFDNHPEDAIPISIDHVVAKKAAQIRLKNRKITSEDALQMAAAIIYKADEFHTFDGTAKHLKKCHLLPLNGKTIVDNLVICEPYCQQLNLLSPREDDEAET